MNAGSCHSGGTGHRHVSCQRIATAWHRSLPSDQHVRVAMNGR